MTDPYDPLLTYDEAGELLGTGPDLPRRLVTTGRLDHVLDEEEVRIPQSALIAYVTAEERRTSRAARSAIAIDEAAA